MNMSGEDLDSSREILYLNFNQTSTAFSVGTKTGYMLYDLDQVYECQPTYESRNLKDICIIERNYCCSLCAYVSLESPRRLVLYNYTKGTEIAVWHFPNTILAVKLNRQHVVVCLEDTIKIYALKNLNIEKADEITYVPCNIKGLIAMTHGQGNSIIAYPGSALSGSVVICDASEKIKSGNPVSAKTTIPAHKGQLAALTFDENGNKLATASIKGTVIRIFSVEKGEMLFEFRRGIKRCVEIYSLRFDQDAEFLCASSNTETVHIFKLCATEPVNQIDEDGEGWMEMFGRVLSQSAKYLPARVTDPLTQQRCFAYVHLPFFDQITVCSIARIQNVPYVMVASLEGFLYIYELDTKLGGPCHLVKQHRIEGPFEEKPIKGPLSSIIKSSPILSPKQPIISPSENIIKQEVDSDILCVETNDTKNSETGASDIHASNGIPSNCDELPPLLNKVE